jgi:hypothetical protein
LSKALDPIPIQLDKFRTALVGKKLSQSDPLFGVTMKFLRSGLRFDEETKREFSALIQSTFSIDEETLTRELAGEIKWASRKKQHSLLQDEKEKELFTLIPPGWIQEYIDYAGDTEVPTAFNVFCSLVLIGLTLGRRAWFEMGPFRLYPPQGIGLMGPSGVKKTTAGDIALAVLTSSNLCPVYSEKITPEALIEAMVTNGTQGLIYAPEAAVLMGKQKYNEGLIPLVTRLMDCPSQMSTGTISRSTSSLKDVAASVIFCSTVDWFQKNVPEDAFGGGFIPRFHLVYQLYSTREIALPKQTPFGAVLEFGKFLIHLRKTFSGQITFSPCAEKLFVEWYAINKISARHPPHVAAEKYLQRKPNHLIRTALGLHVASCQTKEICERCLQRAIDLLLWNEFWLPSFYEELFRTPHGVDQVFILDQIEASGGVISHSALMRKVQYRMSSGQLRMILTSLREAKQVEELSNSLHHAWRLV